MSAGPIPARATRFDGWDALILLYAALAALCRPLTVPAVVAVLLAGAVLVAVAVRPRVRPRRPTCPRRSVLPWLVLALLLVGWELIAVFWGNDSAQPTLSLLLDPVLDTYPGPLVGYLGWLFIGFHFLAR